MAGCAVSPGPRRSGSSTRLAPDLEPVVINHQLSQTSQREALAALRDRTSRVIVCVNMLGEGFDLPALKVAAFYLARLSDGPGEEGRLTPNR